MPELGKLSSFGGKELEPRSRQGSGSRAMAPRWGVSEEGTSQGDARQNCYLGLRRGVGVGVWVGGGQRGPGDESPASPLSDFPRSKAPPDIPTPLPSTHPLKK